MTKSSRPGNRDARKHAATDSVSGFAIQKKEAQRKITRPIARSTENSAGGSGGGAHVFQRKKKMSDRDPK